MKALASFRRKLFFQVRPHERYDFYHVVHQCNLDWLIIDTPEFPDAYIYDYKNEFGYKVLYLNAEKDWNLPDVNIIQGCLNGKYSGPQYVILRSALSEYNTGVNNNANGNCIAAKIFNPINI